MARDVRRHGEPVGEPRLRAPRRARASSSLISRSSTRRRSCVSGVVATTTIASYRDPPHPSARAGPRGGRAPRRSSRGPGRTAPSAPPRAVGRWLCGVPAPPGARTPDAEPQTVQRPVRPEHVLAERLDRPLQPLVGRRFASPARGPAADRRTRSSPAVDNQTSTREPSIRAMGIGLSRLQRGSTSGSGIVSEPGQRTATTRGWPHGRKHVDGRPGPADVERSTDRPAGRTGAAAGCAVRAPARGRSSRRAEPGVGGGR